MKTLAQSPTRKRDPFLTTVPLATLARFTVPLPPQKAERLRFEKGETGSGGSSVKSASVRRASMKKGGGDSVQAQKLQANTPINAQVKEVYRGTKLFWHTREKIEIVLSESKPYNSLILSTLNETAKVIGALVFIDLDVASSLIDGDALAKAIEKAVESAERSAKGAKGAAQTRKLDMTERAEIENRVRKEMLANLVLLRLKLVDGQATIQTLGSDPPEVQSNFVMGANPGVPLSDLPQFEVPAAVDFKSGAAVLEEMNAMSSGLKNATAASDRASSQLRAALDAIEKLKALSQGSVRTRARRSFRALRRARAPRGPSHAPSFWPRAGEANDRGLAGETEAVLGDEAAHRTRRSGRDARAMRKVADVSRAARRTGREGQHRERRAPQVAPRTLIGRGLGCGRGFGKGSREPHSAPRFVQETYRLSFSPLCVSCKD